MRGRERGKETVEAPERMDSVSGKVSETVVSECVYECVCVCARVHVCVLGLYERKRPILCF